MPSKNLEDPCVDCQSAEAVLTVRKRRLCRECFLYYVNSKCRKRMESYRIRNSDKSKRRKLLVPVSCGVSSLSLLSILDQQLERQRDKSRGFTAYEIHVLLVDMTVSGVPGPKQDHLDILKETFPEHNYSILPLEKIFAYEDSIEIVLADAGLQNRSRQACKDSSETLRCLLASFTSLTARTDMEALLLRRLIVAFAKVEDCESILWGDSDTRLSSKVLASVAKGRGASVPWHVCDGPSPFGVAFNFPLRELSKAELTQYSTMALPNLQELILSMAEETPSGLGSVDTLMGQYVESQGSRYPSIMANVVRTVNKLQRPAPATGADSCALCGDYISNGEVEAPKDNICYACSRLKLEFKEEQTS